MAGTALMIRVLAAHTGGHDRHRLGADVFGELEKFEVAEPDTLVIAPEVRLLTSLLEVQVSQVANRSNEIMKKLSAWAGIILVPTLIAGIYGMNFRQMPELRWTVGYPFALGTMALAAFLLYRTFKKRGWL